MHITLPIIHWPSFMAEYEEVDRIGSLNRVPRSWSSLLFSLFACASLFSNDRELTVRGGDYLRTSIGLYDIVVDKPDLYAVRTSLLTSTFLYEMNMKSASWLWVSYAINTAHDIKLNVEDPSCGPIEAETRRRVWWALYTRERMLAFELGRPFTIHDDDNEIELPSPVDEALIGTNGQQSASSPENPFSLFLGIIQMAQALPHLSKTLRAAVIPMPNLEAFDKHVRMCSLSFPLQCQASSTTFLDPRFLPPVLSLQSIGMTLHKHNLSPVCPPEMRHTAFKQCLSIARETACLVARCQPPDADPDVINESKSLIASSATSIVCTHLWRCILFLLFCEDYHGALLCIQTCSLISDTKVVKATFARDIRSFIENLIRKLQNQKGETGTVPTDDELLAHAIGDVTTRLEEPAWTNGIAHHTMSSNPSTSGSRSATGNQSLTPDDSAASVADSDRSWAEWEWIERTVLFLYEQQQAQRQGSAQPPLHQSEDHAMTTHSSASHPSGETRVVYHSVSSQMQSSRERDGGSNMSGGATSRMAIASII
ncbi:hypothetical protein KEM56_006788 [Ascosphaera pollenicola]|nr:hypothetical protein KEM56_006788 [Ascosphaera pollenicola]